MTMRNHAKVASLAAAALLALGAGGCASMHAANHTASNEHRSARETVSDASITAKVKTAFATDKTVKARDINVDTKNGVVTLNGTVSSSAERNRAINIARNTAGVVDVKDNLKVSG